MADIKIGVTVPNNWGISDVKDVVQFGPLAEELGFESVWVMDHLFNNGYIGERLDDKPYYHPLATLSYISATTENILLGTSVLVLPYHNPVELAKYAATLDHMSLGRVLLGVGVGAMTEEFEALGIPMSQRGSLTNENIRIMKELWTNPSSSYSSKRWNFSEVKFAPKPLQTPYIPLWIGGSSSGALKRVVNLGDGWHPSGITAEEFSIGRREIFELAETAGRAPESLMMSARVEVEVGGGPSSARAVDRARLSSVNSDQMVAGIEAYRSAGVQHIVLALNSGEVGRLKETMYKVSEQVMPHFK